jgi:zinc protease
VLEEFNMRVANNPDARLTEQIMAALYLNHPYGRPVIGWRRRSKLDREDAGVLQALLLHRTTRSW